MVRRSVNAVRPTKARATLVLFAPISAKITYNGKRRVRKFGQLPKSDSCTKRNNGVARHLHALALIASVPRNIRGRTVCVLPATLPACACFVSYSCFASAHSWTRAFDFCVAHGLFGEMHLPLCEFIYQCVWTRKRPSPSRARKMEIIRIIEKIVGRVSVARERCDARYGKRKSRSRTR